MMKDIYTLIALGLAMCGIECSAQTVSGQVAGHDYVDLGLPSGTKWATYNVGATKPTEYGDYFAWGETKPKEDYSWSTYKWTTDEGYTFTKYVASSKYGTVDNKKVLEAADDAATANWGSAWRMPTWDEIKELKNGCTWEWVDDFNDSSVKGQLGTSKTNGNSIFLPAADFCYLTDMSGADAVGRYWTSSLVEDYSYYACYLSFTSSLIYWDYFHRYYGRRVRAVTR